MAPSPDTPAAVSPLLLAAQERLLALRQANRERLAHQDAPRREVPASPEPPPTADCPAPPPTLAETIAALPPHLGWENPRLAEHIRRITNDECRITNEEWNVAGGGLPTSRGDKPCVGATPGGCPDDKTPAGLPARRRDDQRSSASAHTRSSASAHVRVFPDVALAMLRRKQAAAGRVWLLLRHLDQDGRGWLTVAQATAALTGDDSPLRICGRRQLANLLNAGDGLFWDRPAPHSTNDDKTNDDKTTNEPRLWLRSVARVAAGLGVGRLAIAPVALDLTALTGTIGHVRAHLYASFHSGRQKTDALTGRRHARAPIARATLAKLADACPNSQRAYEKRARVRATTAFAVGPEAPRRAAAASATQTAVAQETAWQRGRAFFRLTDHHGRFGRPGRTYLAWQLPNEYTGPHQRLTRGRMKRLNRALADLLDNGMTGNDERPEAPAPHSKRFFGNAKAAWTADRRHATATPTDRYWRAPNGGWHVWQESPVVLSSCRHLVMSSDRPDCPTTRRRDDATTRRSSRNNLRP